MPTTPVFRKLRTGEFKASLGYIAKHPKQGEDLMPLSLEKLSENSADRLHCGVWEEDGCYTA